MTNTYHTNPWQLFSDEPDYYKAHEALEIAWIFAKKMSRADAERYMYSVMGTYSHVGASDTEPRAELQQRLYDYYGEEQ